MNLGLFINGAAKEGAICAFDLVRAVRDAGHEMSLYAPSIHPDSDASLWMPFSPVDWSDEGWWKARRLDLAMFYGVGRFPVETLAAARRSGATVVVETDSDGFLSPCHGWWGKVRRRWDGRLDWGHRLRAAKASLDEVWVHGRHTERETLRFLSEADVIKIESEVPARILKGFLERRGRLDLARRVEVIPFAVRPCFTDPPLPERKEDLVIVAGRLGDVQKGPVETAAALRAFLRNGGPTRVEIHSRGLPDSSLLALADQFRTVTVHVDSPRELLADRLRAASVLFSRARWETTPVIALEALCSGCTVVAPRELPGFASLLEDDRSGTLYARERTRDAVEALREETSGWRTGARVPRALASKWRRDVSVSAVAQRLAMLAAITPFSHTLVA